MTRTADGKPPPRAAWAWLGRVPFAETVALQETLRDQVLAGQNAERLLLCEHDPVVTLGRRARPEHLLVAPDALTRRGVTIASATRGGEVTYHGPGQLVGYPVVRLRRGVLAHVEGMAAAVIAVLSELGIASEWRRTCPGVWVGDAKICAFGVHVRHGVAIHGFALNVDLKDPAFDAIVPCGQPGTAVTSIAQLDGGRSPTVAAMANKMIEPLARTLQIDFVADPDHAVRSGDSRFAIAKPEWGPII